MRGWAWVACLLLIAGLACNLSGESTPSPMASTGEPSADDTPSAALPNTTTPQPCIIQVTDPNIVAYSSPSPRAAPLIALTQNQVFAVDALSDTGWYRLGDTGWVIGSGFVTYGDCQLVEVIATRPQSLCKITNTSGFAQRIYTDSAESAHLGRFPPDEQHDAFALQNGYYQIYLEPLGLYGWVNAGAMTPNEYCGDLPSEGLQVR